MPICVRLKPFWQRQNFKVRSDAGYRDAIRTILRRLAHVQQLCVDSCHGTVSDSLFPFIFSTFVVVATDTHVLARTYARIAAAL